MGIGLHRDASAEHWRLFLRGVSSVGHKARVIQSQWLQDPENKENMNQEQKETALLLNNVSLWFSGYVC